MLRTLLISFFLTLSSVLIVINFPVSIVEGDGTSPYLSKIYQLKLDNPKGIKKGSPEWIELEILWANNHAWFKRQDNKISSENPFITLSTKYSFILLFIWAFAFYFLFPISYFLFRNRINYSALSVLSFPLVFTALNLLSWAALLLISIGVLSVFTLLCIQFKRKNNLTIT